MKKLISIILLALSFILSPKAFGDRDLGSWLITWTTLEWPLVYPGDLDFTEANLTIGGTGTNGTINASGDITTSSAFIANSRGDNSMGNLTIFDWFDAPNGMLTLNPGSGDGAIDILFTDENNTIWGQVDQTGDMSFAGYLSLGGALTVTNNAVVSGLVTAGAGFTSLSNAPFTGNASGLTNLRGTNITLWYQVTNLLAFSSGAVTNTTFAAYYTNSTPYIATVYFTATGGSTGAFNWAYYIFDTNSAYLSGQANPTGIYTSSGLAQTAAFTVYPREYFACSNYTGTANSGTTNRVVLHLP